MTCREFIDVADSLSLREVSQIPDEQIVLHVRECSNCENWLQQRRLLAGAMQNLGNATADREASPAVERALIQAFHDQASKSIRPAEVISFTPAALRLSRWLGIGAYGAVAAALIIAIFLGYRVWHNPAEMPLESQNVPAVSSENVETADSQQALAPSVLAAAPRAPRRQANSVKRVPATAASPEELLARDGYTDLMFCDPLSCASDAQVVRMELPAPGSSEAPSGQTVLADVVVGDDGLVRAIRMVN